MPHLPGGDGVWAAAGEGLLPGQGCYVGCAVVLAQHQQQVQQLLTVVQLGQEGADDVHGIGFPVDVAREQPAVGVLDGVPATDILLNAGTS
jgi:hypothetical protein